MQFNRGNRWGCRRTTILRRLGERVRDGEGGRGPAALMMKLRAGVFSRVEAPLTHFPLYGVALFKVFPIPSSSESGGFLIRGIKMVRFYDGFSGAGKFASWEKVISIVFFRCERG